MKKYGYWYKTYLISRQTDKEIAEIKKVLIKRGLALTYEGVFKILIEVFKKYNKV